MKLSFAEVLEKDCQSDIAKLEKELAAMRKQLKFIEMLKQKEVDGEWQLTHGK